MNRSQACWETPACIIRVQNPQDVAKALQIIQEFQVPFSIRSGGHSPNPGWSSIEDPGILIDLSALNTIAVSEDKTTASIGPGQRWGSVYESLDPYGVNVIGGRIPSVGVGGLLLGGEFVSHTSLLRHDQICGWLMTPLRRFLSLLSRVRACSRQRQGI